MDQQGRFDLCPKCGALARDGVCQSCGYEIPEVKEMLEKAAQAKEMLENTEGLANPYAINGQYSQTDSGSVNHSYNNPYSPYAASQSSKYTWLIIGMILGAAAMALIVFVVLLYCATNFFRSGVQMENYFYQEEYDDAKIDNEYDSGNDYHDDYSYDTEDYYHDGYSHDIEDYYHNGYSYDAEDYYHNGYSHDTEDYNHDGYSHDADDYYHDNHEMDNGYYSLQNDVKANLSYQIEWECYEYETDLENVIITVNYPVVMGKGVPNLDMLNARIAEEVTFFVDYFEEEYQPYLTENGYFGVVAQGYVTCMSEEILSIVFSETIISDYFESVSLYCINIDMENGVIWNNNDLLKIDDGFSVDFRLRSEKQNGIIEGLDEMSDQELTEYLCASNLIAFYIPEGMEIGLNYDEGWVTVTYRDYENYLNIF